MFIFFNIFTEWKYVTADIEHDSLKKLYVMSISACSPSELFFWILDESSKMDRLRVFGPNLS